MNALCAALACLFAYLVLTAGATTANYPTTTTACTMRERASDLAC